MMKYLNRFVSLLILVGLVLNKDGECGWEEDTIYLDYFSHNLPVFSRAFLTGGDTPLIHVITDSTVSFENGHTQFVTFTCTEWFSHVGFHARFEANNVILIISCSHSNGTRTQQLANKLENFYTSYPSVLSRPQLLILLPQETLTARGNVLPQETLTARGNVLPQETTRDYAMHHLYRVQSERSIDHIAFYPNRLFTKQMCADNENTQLNISFISLRDPLSLRYTLLEGLQKHCHGNYQPAQSKRFHSYHNVSLTVAIAAYSPFTKITSLVNGSQTYDGFCIELLNVMAEQLHFRYNITVSGQFGSLVDGKWNGIVGMVHAGEADVALTGLTITSQREMALDFTNPFFRDPTAVVVKTGSTGLLYQLSPLQLPVWGVTCLSILLIIGLISALIGPLGSVCKLADERVSRVSATVWFTIQSSLCQGVSWIPEGIPARLIAMSLWVTLLVISTTYQGNLIASLATQKPSLPFTTLSEVADDTQYTLLIRPDSSQRTLFESSTDGVYSRIWRKISRDPESFVAKTQTAVEKVLSQPNRYIFLSDRTGLEREFLPHCDVTFLPETFFPSGFGMGLPEASPWKPHFNQIIRNLEESGIFLRWKKRHFPVDKCSIKRKLEKLKSQPITLRETTASFLILSVGIGAGTLTFVVEFCWMQIRRKLTNRSILVSNCINTHNNTMHSAFVSNRVLEKHTGSSNRENFTRQPQPHNAGTYTFFKWNR